MRITIDIKKEKIMPKVSVIIPVYNTNEKYLFEAIESILNQTYKDYEITVVDDGAVNNINKILLPYEDKIKYIYQKNRGPAYARNKEIKNSVGKYIAFLDQDDVWLPKKWNYKYKH